jgi:hypothetical protein
MFRVEHDLFFRSLCASQDGEIFHARILCIRRAGQYVGYRFVTCILRRFDIDVSLCLTALLCRTIVSIGGDSEVFSNVDALLKRVQPKTKLLAPSPDARQSVAGRGGGPPGMGMQQPGSFRFRSNEPASEQILIVVVSCDAQNQACIQHRAACRRRQRIRIRTWNALSRSVAA